MDIELELKEILTHVVQDSRLQAGFLAALSELENCGAKKIMRYQTRANTDLSLLQHAAEEARHAYFFQKQACKLGVSMSFPWLDGRRRRYLDRLELFIARCLSTKSSLATREGCYVLTTYYIEKRATWLYTCYEEVLEAHRAPFSLQGILREEAGHLNEMEQMKEKLGLSPELEGDIQAFEATLCAEWVAYMQKLVCGMSPR